MFISYSRAVGGLVVPGGSTASTLPDLRGRKIGVAGGPVDKSWLILQALALDQSFDLKSETEQVFGAPPLMLHKALSGEIDGAIRFWHFMVKMEAQDFRRLISVTQATEAMGLDPAIPLLGYVVKGEMVRERPDLICGLGAVSRAAKMILAFDDAEWDRLRPRMDAGAVPELRAPRHRFRRLPVPGDAIRRRTRRRPIRSAQDRLTTQRWPPPRRRTAQ